MEAPSKVSWRRGGKLSKSVKGRDPSYADLSGQVEALMMRVNLLKDFEGNGEDATSIFEGDHGFFSRAH